MTQVVMAETHQQRAFDMMKKGRPFDEYIKEQLLAVEEVRAGNPTSDAVDILQQTGWLYSRNGHYIEALTYLQESTDSITKRKELGIQPNVSNIRSYGSLANLYARFGLYEEALQSNAKAISMSEAKDNPDLCDLWKMRAAIFAYKLHSTNENVKTIADSALLCYDIALRMADKLTDKKTTDIYKQHLIVDKASFFIENPTLYPDSIFKMIKSLDETDINSQTTRTTIKALKGRAFVLIGKFAEGVKMLEETLAEFKNQNWTESIEWNLELLAKSYAEYGGAERFASLFPEYVAYRDSLMNREKLNAVIGADFRYRTEQKTREAEFLKVQNRQANRIIIYESIAIAVGSLLAIALLFILFLSIRRARREKEQNQHIIQEILDHQQKLNKKIEELTTAKETRQESTETEEEVNLFNLSLLSKDDENTFRQAFNRLHPHFLKDLREDYPEITQNDELICMLIYMKVPAIDMALIIGISRMSLNSARYRVRKRLNLGKETDLDTFLQNRRS